MEDGSRRRGRPPITRWQQHSWLVTRVDKPDGPEGCWVWNVKIGAKAVTTPYVQVHGRRVSARRYLYEEVNGSVAASDLVVEGAECEEGCINPFPGHCQPRDRSDVAREYSAAFWKDREGNGAKVTDDKHREQVYDAMRQQARSGRVGSMAGVPEAARKRLQEEYLTAHPDHWDQVSAAVRR